MSQPADRRVVHVIATTQRRGAEVMATELSPALTALGWPSSVAALVSVEHGLPVPALGQRRLGLATLAALRRRLRDAQVTVAHGSTTLPASVLAGLGLRTSLVYRSVGDPRFWAGSVPKRARTGLLLRRADRVVALTAAAAEVLVDHYGLPPDRVVVIPNGVDADRLPVRTVAGAMVARERLGIRSGGPVVVAIGALRPEKNLALAIDAVSRLAEATLIVVGEGPERVALEALADRRGSGRVVFTGSVSTVGQVLEAADALVLTSTSEGVPGVAIEAGLTGVPVVATRVGWIDQVVLDGVTGVLVPPGDAQAVADGLTLALAVGEEMGRRAREHCLRHFGMDVVAQRWSELLDEVT